MDSGFPLGRRSDHRGDRAVARFLITLLVLAITGAGLASSPPDASAEFRINLDPAFSSWVTEEGELTYREIARRFVAAGGRDSEDYDQKMEALARSFRTHAEQNGSPTAASERAAMIRSFIFEKREFTADLDLENTENLFPDSILERKQGFCLGLSLLLADLGERIGWPLGVASAPRHTFVRVAGENPVNIETTLGGRSHDDAWYRERYDLSGNREKLLRDLTPKETAAHLINNFGFTLLQRGFLIPARRELDDSLALSKQIVETHINLGVLEARSEKFKKALVHFDHALGLWPSDPYLLLNCINAHLALDDTLGATVRAIELAQTGTAPEESASARAEVVRRLLADLDTGKNWRLLQKLVTTENEHAAEKYGKKVGLVGTYYKGREFEKKVLSRVDEDISFRWSWEAPAPGMPKDRFSIRWKGWFQATEKDLYRFFVTCSDGIRVRIDGRLVVDSWRQANDNFPQGAVELDPGLHDIEIEYFEAIGEAGVSIIVTAKKEERPLDLPKHLLHGSGE